MNTQAIIENEFDNGELVKGKPYHTELPRDLAEWHCYLTDRGHCIMALIKGAFDPTESELEQFLKPVPVKAVLHGYSFHREFVLVDLPYDAELGLLIDVNDSEF